MATESTTSWLSPSAQLLFRDELLNVMRFTPRTCGLLAATSALALVAPPILMIAAMLGIVVAALVDEIGRAHV